MFLKLLVTPQGSENFLVKNVTMKVPRGNKSVHFVRGVVPF